MNLSFCVQVIIIFMIIYAKKYENGRKGRKYVNIVVAVDETLKTSSENVTEFIKTFFSEVNVVFWPVGIEIVISEIIIAKDISEHEHLDLQNSKSVQKDTVVHLF